MLTKLCHLLIGIVTVCILGQANASHPNSEVPPDIKKILDRGTLIVALNNRDAPPFFSQDSSGRLSGYDISIAENIAQQLGVKVVFDRNAQTYDQVVEEVAKGKADVGISLLSITLSRALIVNFTTPYIYVSEALLYNRLQAAQHHYNDVIKQITDKHLSIGILDNSSYVEYAKQIFPKANIVAYSTPGQGMQDVRDGKIFGFFLNEVEIKNWIKTNSGSGLYVNYQLINNLKDPIAIAVAWPNIHFLRWINYFLFVNTQNGTLGTLQKQIYEKN